VTDLDLSTVDPSTWRSDAGALLGGDLVWFPVRHHSPACATHVRALIERVRPYAVLVEGPRTFDDLIPLLVHPEAVYPLAVFAHCTIEAGEGEPVRHGSYYPLCDYSPELVALRTGTAVGAHLGFIDAEHQLLCTLAGADRTGALTHEQHLGFSEALAAAASRAGCRDHNDLWDHLFETSVRDTGDFVGSVGAYGLLARSTTPPDALATDGTLAREAVMAHEIDAVRRARDAAGADAPIVVVTGAFHSSAVRERLASLGDGPDPDLPAGPPGAVVDEGRHLIRYSFDQLDALNGYASGMPSPAWYQRLYELGSGHDADQRRRMLLDVLTDIAERLRDDGPVGATSTPSMVAALQHASGLGSLRGRAMPGRTDLLDAVTSCFVQGDIDTEGVPVRAATKLVLTGDRVGVVPPGTGRPPIADDFDRRARALRLPVDTSTPVRVELDIHRTAAHREKSRFLQGLSYLGVAYGSWAAGPRYGIGVGTDLLREAWVCQLTPATDVGLVEASMFGPTVVEAVSEKFVAATAALEQAEASAADVAAHLTRAAELGVHHAVPRVLDHLRRQATQDPGFGSVVEALTEVELLWTARAPLEGRLLAPLPALAELLYHRACFLIEHLPGLAEAEIDPAVKAVLRLRDGLVAGEWAGLDPDLFWNAVTRLDHAHAPAPLAGMTVGLLWSAGVMSDDDIVTAVRGRIMGLGHTPDSADYLRGLMQAAREAVWQVPELTRSIGELIERWDDDEFLSRLPGLRSAFSSLTPRETDRVAELVGEEQGVAPVVTDLAEAALLANLALDAAAARLLRDDGIAWAGER
jgi:hypothetical protein